MLILVETAAFKAWEAYHKATRERVYQYGAATILLVLYILFMLMGRTPNVVAYNGVDIWFWLVEQVPYGGTVLVSAILALWMGDIVWKDLKGIKTLRERREDSQKKAKDKNFSPKDKAPFRVNPYYILFGTIEGILWGSLIFALLPDLLQLCFQVFGENSEVPRPFDAMESLYAYNSNALQDIALALGAGVFEEIMFRAMFFMLMFHLAKSYGKKIAFLKQFDLKQEELKPFPIKVPKHDRKSNPYLLLVFLSTVVYSASHFILPFGDHFSFFGFIFRMFFGGFMYAIFVWRGPAMAMWTHVIYDLLYFGLRWWM
ncbi:MAG: CPBP family glutamic-type intramembrane protease [Bacteroidia bacterium]|nr:CPBP family glutamic-type intramembrane protease [Bacteroidia bacterium]